MLTFTDRNLNPIFCHFLLESFKHSARGTCLDICITSTLKNTQTIKFHFDFFAPVKHFNQIFIQILFLFFYLSDKTSKLHSSLNLTLKFRETAVPAVEISLVFPQVWKFRFKPCSFKTVCEGKDLKSDFLKLWQKHPNSSNNSVSVRDFPLVKILSLCANAFWVTGCVCRSASLSECVSLRCCFSCAERAATLKPQAFGCSTSGRKVAWHSPGLNQFHPDLSENRGKKDWKKNTKDKPSNRSQPIRKQNNSFRVQSGFFTLTPPP